VCNNPSNARSTVTTVTLFNTSHEKGEQNIKLVKEIAYFKIHLALKLSDINITI
jgi:hypothetical protein